MKKPGNTDRPRKPVESGTAIAGRVSMTTVAALDTYARKRGITRSQAVRRLVEAALKQGLGDLVGHSSKASALDQLSRKG